MVAESNGQLSRRSMRAGIVDQASSACPRPTLQQTGGPAGPPLQDILQDFGDEGAGDVAGEFV
jgi:hypothetical protein